ncbi:MAG: hypothetical protein AB1772_12090 [Candidatus Zixiibacteriota bacterium]
MPKARPKPTSELLQQLKELRSSFESDATAQKIAILTRLSRTSLLKPSELTAYHDLLLFLRAFPDSPKIARIAERELRQFGQRVDRYKLHSRDNRGRRLANTGMARTETTHPYSYEMTWRLHAKYADFMDVGPDADSDDLSAKLQNFFPFVAAWQENDALENDDDFDIEKWLEMARGRNTRSRLQELVKLLSSSDLPVELRQYFYDDLDLPVLWKLGDSAASRTLARLPAHTIYYQHTPFLRRTTDLRAELAKPASPLRLLSLRDGRVYVQAINEALAVRNRELFPITFANPAEVYLVEPGRGLQILIYGMLPDVRLPLETNFGAMLVRNGIAVGYGVAATLFDRVEIAINTFPAFRGGESSFAIEQFFRLFYHHFGSRAFVVRKTQMGYDDDEALRSGAFWFYYKLGFRSVNPRVRRLADREYTKIRSRANYRTPLKTMKRLSKGDVFFHWDPNMMNNWQELSVADLGYAVTRLLAQRYDGDRKEGIRRSVASITRLLGIRGTGRWTKDERIALERMAPMLVGIPDLARWTSKEKSDLVGVIRGKGCPHEREYVLRCNRHLRYQAAVTEMARNCRKS